jgi:hypothetical protein
MAKEGILDSHDELSSPDLFGFCENSILGLSARQVAALAVAVTLGPLIALGAVQGLALGPSRAQSILLDPAIFARFLVALPILILASNKCSRCIDEVAMHFREAGLVTGVDLERFGSMISSELRLRESFVPNWICLAVAYMCSAVFVLLIAPAMFLSWRTAGSSGRYNLSFAGWWFVLVSQPIYLFVLLRFLYRTALWWRFLWRTSRLNLQLHAVHPDGAGGLGFLGLTLAAFSLPVFGISASFAGATANLLLLHGVPVNELKYEIAGTVFIVVGLFAAPLSFMFLREMERARTRDVLRYWALAEDQSRRFERQWIISKPQQIDSPSHPDFSEAASLSAILERARKMTMLPFELRDFFMLVVAAVLPFVPVAALAIPLSTILRTILRFMA